MVICLERGTDCLRMFQLMPLPSPNPIISCLIYYYYYYSVTLTLTDLDLVLDLDFDRAGGAYSAPPDPLAGFNGPLLRRRKGGEGKWEKRAQLDLNAAVSVR